MKKTVSFILLALSLIFTIISCQPTTTVIVIDPSAFQEATESVDEITLSDGDWQYTQNVTLAEQDISNRKYKYTSTRVTVLNFTVKSGEIKSISSGNISQCGLITGNIENAKSDFRTTDRLTGSSTAINDNGVFTSNFEVPESGNALYILLLSAYLPSSSTTSTQTTASTAAASAAAAIPSLTETYDIKANTSRTKYILTYKTIPDNYTSAEINFVKQ